MEGHRGNPGPTHRTYMKILILSCSTGGGHNSAARAISDVLQSRGAETEIMDPIVLSSEKMKDTVSGVYNGLIKNAPIVFGAVYKIGAAYEALHLPSPVYWANSTYAQKLADYIAQNGFERVVCCHLYCMEAMTAVREKLHHDIPCIGIFTDYTLIPFMADTKLDAYFIPHEELRGEITQKMPDATLIPSGIPVNLKFRTETTQEEARDLLGLPQNKKIVLAIFGSVGCSKAEPLCERMETMLSDDSVAYVILGDNEKLYVKLSKKYEGSEKIRLLSYTDQVALYMRAADVLITKAGGLSSTEAAVTGVPIIHLRSIPGCETKNADFFSEHGMSLATRNTKEAVQLANELLAHPEEADEMRDAQRRTINPDAATEIADMILRE